MANVTDKHTHFTLSIRLRFVGIPTRWVAKEENGRRYLVPLVNQSLERRNEKIADADEVRRQFFRMGNDEQSALDFLNGVGVWSAEEGGVEVRSDGTLRKGRVVVGERGSYLVGAFGHRFIQNGRALPWDVESLCRNRDHWRGLMRNQSIKLRKALSPPFSSDTAKNYIFAVNSQFQNTLPVHMEWSGSHPLAVIQPVTGEELLKALAWIDLITGASVRVCAKCGIEYTRGGWKYCSPQCEHANTVRAWRIRKRKLVKKSPR